MPRFFVPPPLWCGLEIELPEQESRHLSSVLRLRDGDEISIFDGLGREARARVTGCAKKKVSLLVLSESATEEQRFRLVLGQAIPKGNGMDDIVRQATELGVAGVIPLVTERVVARWSKPEATARVARWQRVAVSAAKQCGLNRLPEIEPVCTPAAFMERIKTFDVAFIGSLGAAATPLSGALEEWRGRKPGAVLLMIGPEGDFTEIELQAASQAGALPVSFGRLVFRVGTAALYGLSILRYELGN